MPRKLLFSKDAAKFLERLDRPTFARFDAAIARLRQNDPVDATLDIKPLAGMSGHFRLRVGKYRMLYELREEGVLIYAYKVAPRGDVYK